MWSQTPRKTNLDCQYCGAEKKTVQSVALHELYCKKNPNAKPKTPSYGMRGKKGSNQHIAGTAKPLTEEQRKQISLKTSKWSRTYWGSEENKKKHAESMQQAVNNNPESYTNPITRGRIKCFTYNGVRFQGSWELIFYKWAEAQGLNPVRVKQGFPYIWNGNRTYFPDFYIDCLNLYIEVKGYKTDRDDAKWQQFPNKLLVVDQKAIDLIKKGCYTIEVK